MTTVRDAVDEVVSDLNFSYQGDVNTLDGALSTGATSVTFNYDTVGVGVGSTIEIGTEVMLVLESDPDTKTATVIRGYQGSDEVLHSDGDLVRVDAQFTDFSVLRKMRNEILSWPTSLFDVKSVTFDASTTGTVDTGFEEVYFILDSVEKQSSDMRWARRKMKLVRGVDANVLLQSRESHHHDAVEVNLAVPFDLSTFTGSTDLKADCGIPESAHDIVVTGTEAELVQPTEVSRTFLESQGDSRDADEVPPTHRIQASEMLRRRAENRIGQEAARLRGRWPYRNEGV